MGRGRLEDRKEEDWRREDGEEDIVFEGGGLEEEKGSEGRRS